jgi:hypothetical protein
MTAVTFPLQRSYTTKLPLSLMRLTPLLALKRKVHPPELEDSIEARATFYKGVTLEVARMVAAMDHEEREELETTIQCWLDECDVDPGLKVELVGMQATLRTDFSNLLAKAAAQARAIEVEASDPDHPIELFNKKDVPWGFSAVPHAFVKSGLFSGATAALMVLGFPGLTIEQLTQRLEQEHLQVMVYLISLVDRFNKDLGRRIQFSPREALKALGWSLNTLSRERLQRVLYELEKTHFMLRDTRKETPSRGGRIDFNLAANVVTDDSLDGDWSVILLPALLAVVSRKDLRTQLHLKTLALLPQGITTWAYAFTESQVGETNWYVDDLCKLAGLTSNRADKRKEKLSEALKTLKQGWVDRRSRGLAAKNAGGSVVTRCHFEPVLADFRYEKQKDGRERVVLVKVKRSAAANKVALAG